MDIFSQSFFWRLSNFISDFGRNSFGWCFQNGIRHVHRKVLGDNILIKNYLFFRSLSKTFLSLGKFFRKVCQNFILCIKRNILGKKFEEKIQIVYHFGQKKVCEFCIKLWIGTSWATILNFRKIFWTLNENVSNFQQKVFSWCFQKFILGVRGNILSNYNFSKTSHFTFMLAEIANYLRKNNT